MIELCQGGKTVLTRVGDRKLVQEFILDDETELCAGCTAKPAISCGQSNARREQVNDAPSDASLAACIAEHITGL